MTEVWKPVVGREGEYEVSDHGNVRSVDRAEIYVRVNQYSGRNLTITRRHRGRMLRPGRKACGHVSVALGRGNSVNVHRLVLEAFVGPCPDGMEALHENDVPSDNALGNLRWGTRGENLLDAVRNGKKPVGEQVRHSKLRCADIPVIRKRLVTEGPCAIARSYGVNETTIRQVRDGTSWRHVA